jgi:hypothetical protein
MSINEVFRAQAQFQESLLAKPNVVGVAVGRKNSTGELAVVTLVEQKLPLAALSAEAVIPRQVDGVKTDVVEVGYLRAYDSPRDRYRPTIPSGVSIGHFKITAGTLGTIVTDVNTGEKFILSNNHVLANSNSGVVGDAILQPGPTDGGSNPSDMVARLERFIQISFVGDPDTPPPPPPPPAPTPGGCDIVSSVVGVTNALASLVGSKQRVTSTGVQSVSMPAPVAAPISAQAVDNEVDCALAKPVDANMFTGQILGIGQVSGTKVATLGMKVRKSGRTTGYTEGTVNLLNATVNVAYGSKTARFTGQIITSPMSQGGDSGSLIVDGTENIAVGLLFAGSNLSTIFNPIDRVLALLNVTI